MEGLRSSDGQRTVAPSGLCDGALRQMAIGPDEKKGVYGFDVVRSAE